MTVVGNYGGKIRHSELRDNATVQTDKNDRQVNFNNKNMDEEQD
jgi:hypothetical protein